MTVETYDYDRAYLAKSIPDCDPANVGPCTEEEREQFAEAFDQVLSTIRA